jgi:hypothetical protein
MLVLSMQEFWQGALSAVMAVIHIPTYTPHPTLDNLLLTLYTLHSGQPLKKITAATLGAERAKVTKLMVDAGARVICPNDQGRTPLHGNTQVSSENVVFFV